MNSIDLAPISILARTITHLTFSFVDLQLGQSATLRYELRDSDERIVIQDYAILDGQDYQGWHDDEPYIAAWLLAKLNLVAAKGSSGEGEEQSSSEPAVE